VHELWHQYCQDYWIIRQDYPENNFFMRREVKITFSFTMLRRILLVKIPECAGV